MLIISFGTNQRVLVIILSTVDFNHLRFSMVKLDDDTHIWTANVEFVVFKAELFSFRKYSLTPRSFSIQEDTQIFCVFGFS